jgi:hypothetical protein
MAFRKMRSWRSLLNVPQTTGGEPLGVPFFFPRFRRTIRMSVSALPKSQTRQMRRDAGNVWRGIMAGAVAAGLLVGCADGPDPMSSAASRSALHALSASNVRGTFFCTAHLAAKGTTAAPTVTCTRNRGSSAGSGRTKAADVILGNQAVNVLLNLTSPAFNSTTRIFSINVSITNLLAQPIGTTDGVTTAPNAVQAFFSSGPFASGGSGPVTVANPDGTGVFQGDTVPFFQYSPFIPPGATSAIKNWQFLFGPLVTGLSFSVEVDAAVPAQNSVLRWIVLRQGVTSNELNAVWRNTASDVWAVGLRNTIVHYNGTAWAQPITGLQFAAYTSVFGSSGTDVWAVGGQGAAVHWNGTRWTRIATNTSANLTGVWGSAPTNFYAVANGGLAFHYNGSSWSPISFPFAVTGNLHGVWGVDASHVFIAGDGGQIFFFNGTFWSQLASSTTQPLLAIWGTGASNVFAAGGTGTIVHFNGTSWATQASATGHTFSGVGGTSPTDVWAVGASGVTQHFNGTSWSSVARQSGFLITSICSGTAGSTLWAVGIGGSFLSVAGGQFTLSNQSGLPLDGVWANSASDVWASTIGTILHFNGTTWTNTYIADDDSLSSMWGSGPSNMYAVGVAGDIAHFNGLTWATSRINPPTGATGYHGIFGISPNNIDAVGNGGLVEHFNGSSWSFQTRTGAGNLRAVWAGVTTQNFYAVADNGTAFINHNGAGWSSTAFAPANSHGLQAIFGNAPTNVWAAGDSGVVYDLANGSSYSLPSATTGTLTNVHGAWLTSATDVYLVGDGGSVLHFNGTQWLPLAAPAASAFRSIHGTTAQNVYVTGDNGVVLLGTGL